jgi:hypothetical protein
MRRRAACATRLWSVEVGCFDSARVEERRYVRKVGYTAAGNWSAQRLCCRAHWTECDGVASAGEAF